MSGLGLLARVASASILCLVMALAMGVGCAKKVVGSDEPTTQVPPVEDEGKEVSEKGKKWSGWRWSGARDNCVYVVDNECFASEDKACAAASCGDAACQTKDGAPIVVSCQE